MKRHTKQLVSNLLAGVVLLSAASSAIAQNDEPIIELSAKVRTMTKDKAPVQIIVYQDNEQIQSISLEKKYSFDLELALNQAYTVQVKKAGYEPYSVFIDGSVSTKLDRNQKMNMDVMLQTKGSSNDQYYADFPNAIMYWNPQSGMFAERSHYSAHIMEKKQLLEASVVE